MSDATALRPPLLLDSDQTLPSENPMDLHHQLNGDLQIQQPNSSSSQPVNPNGEDSQIPTLPEQAPEDQMEIENAEDPDAVSISSPRNSDANAVASTATSRRGHKRKKVGGKRAAQEKKSKRKLEVLVPNFTPISFIPSRSLDFASHEELLKRLGLWDFVHIEFDKNIRNDLLVQLIASYNPNSRGSYVNEVKIMVNRADMARALRLPVKKPVVSDGFVDEVASAESIAFIDEFVSTWVLLHEDTWIMTDDVLSCIKMIKEGHLEKIDWAGLIWSMVDKELTAPALVNCYYASHLQQLIKWQKAELLKEESKEDVVVKDEEDGEEEDVTDVRMVGVDEIQALELDEHNIELNLGQDNVEKVEVERGQDNAEKVEVERELDNAEQVEVERELDNAEKVEVERGLDNAEKIEVERRQDNSRMVEVEVDRDHDALDFEETKAEESRDWVFNENRDDNVDRPFLHPCNVGELNTTDCGKEKIGGEEEAGEEVEEEEEEEEEPEDDHEGDFHLSSRSMPLDRMPSGSLFQGMEGEPIPFNSGIELRDYAAGDFFSSREESRMLAGSSLFGNGNKREIDHDNDNPHYPVGGSSKRLGSNGLWDCKSGEFDLCFEQMQQLMHKAKMLHAAKEQAYEQSTMNQQVLLNQLHQRESMMDHLRKTAMEENQKSQAEVYRLERELHMMGSLLEGYRKALKETQKAFAEYRARCPQQDEPLYKDVPGSGGLVVSVSELEKICLKQEEERKLNRLMIENKFKDFEEDWVHVFSLHIDGVQILEDRLLDLERVVKDIKEVNPKPENDCRMCPEDRSGH